MQAVSRACDRIDRIGAGTALETFVDSFATDAGSQAPAARLAFAVASALLADAVVWLVQR